MPRPEPIVLRPDPACDSCRGRGSFSERHGAGLVEDLECECAFANLTPEQEAAVEVGAYWIVCRDDAPRGEA